MWFELNLLTTWAQFSGHQADFHCMLINNGALLIFRRSKQRRKMPHASLTYFYWHAGFHGRHRKVFSDKADTLPLFVFVSSSHWAVLHSYVTVQVRWEVNADIVMGRVKIAPFFAYIQVSMWIFMLINICQFHHLYAKMVLGLYVRYGTRKWAIHFLLFLLTPRYESEFAFKDTSIKYPPQKIHPYFEQKKQTDIQ